MSGSSRSMGAAQKEDCGAGGPEPSRLESRINHHVRPFIFLHLLLPPGGAGAGLGWSPRGALPQTIGPPAAPLLGQRPPALTDCGGRVHLLPRSPGAELPDRDCFSALHRLLFDRFDQDARHLQQSRRGAAAGAGTAGAVASRTRGPGDQRYHEDVADGAQEDLPLEGPQELQDVVFFWLHTILINLFNADPILVMIIDFITTGTYKKDLPYFVWYPFDPLQTGVYQIVYAYQIWSGIVAAIGVVGPDCLFQVTCSHICMLLKVLQKDLLEIIPSGESYSKNTSATVGPDIKANEDNIENEKKARKNVIDARAYQNCEAAPEEVFADGEMKEEGSLSVDLKHQFEMLQKLKDCVQRHQKLIKLSADLEGIFSFVLMINFVAGSFIICLVGFQATAADAKQLLKFIMFLCCSLIQVLILTSYGNQLMQTSEGVAEAAYNSRWYVMGGEYRKIIQIIIMRAQKPVEIRAMRFTVLSLNTFTAICSRSWSYFTLLRTIYNPSE